MTKIEGQKLQQGLQSIGYKFPGKQETHRGCVATIRTIGTKPRLIQELESNILPNKSARMWTALRPINPGNGPVGVLFWSKNVDECRDIMFIHVTRDMTMLFKDGVVLLV